MATNTCSPRDIAPNRRLDREAVKDHSPGLQAWGSHTHEKRPEGATDVGIRRQTPQCFMNSWCRKHIRSPLQGDFHLFVDPGLKAWAIVSNRFAVKYDGQLPNFFLRLRTLGELISQQPLARGCREIAASHVP